MQTTNGHGWFARVRRSPQAAFLILAALVSAAALIPAAQARFIDGDEGFYLMAARLVADGQRLYSDFFFPQMPLVPQVFGRWFWLVGPGWRAARLLAALLGVGTAVLLAHEARRRTQCWFWGFAALFLFLASGLVLGWVTTAKSYGLASFLLVGGVVALERPGPRATFLGGLLLALAIGTRLYLVVALPCAALHLLRQRRPRRAWLAFAGGALLAAVSVLPVALRDPGAFYFGNVVFHALRDPNAMRLGPQLVQKWLTLLGVLPFRNPEGTFTVQFLGLLVVAVAALLSPGRARNRLPRALWVTLLVTSFVPTPSYPQYFCLLIPFLVLEVVELLAALPRARLVPFLIPAGLAYLALGMYDGNRYFVSAYMVPGVVTSDRISRWSIPTVERAARQIDAQNVPQAISWWPGYFVSTRTAILPELANDFGMVVANKVTAEERAHLHLVTHGELGEWIKEQKVPLIVAGNWTSGMEAGLLSDHGYRTVAQVENVTLWRIRPPP